MGMRFCWMGIERLRRRDDVVVQVKVVEKQVFTLGCDFFFFGIHDW
jgi:hypothetical protein